MIGAIKHFFRKLEIANEYLANEYQVIGKQKTLAEFEKRPYRTDIINFLLSSLNRECVYLEIGVRNPSHNFNKINVTKKYSVDPGLENAENNVDFKITSDAFFSELQENKILNYAIKFDVIFIDGLHLAEQVDRDINNSLRFLKDDGFIVLHDCNPPTEFHASESYDYELSPARTFWNGTTWKAFFKARQRADIYSCCIDTDWGVGIISKSKNLGSPSAIGNEFFEFHTLEKNRNEALNLMSYEELKSLF